MVIIISKLTSCEFVNSLLCFIKCYILTEFLGILSMLAFKHGRLQYFSFKSDLQFLAMYFPLVLLSQGSCLVQKAIVILVVAVVKYWRCSCFLTSCNIFLHGALATNINSCNSSNTLHRRWLIRKEWLCSYVLTNREDVPRNIILSFFVCWIKRWIPAFHFVWNVYKGHLCDKSGYLMHIQMVLTLASILFSRFSFSRCTDIQLWISAARMFFVIWRLVPMALYVSADYLDGATVGKAACQCQSVAYILLPCDHLVQCLLLLVFNHEVPIWPISEVLNSYNLGSKV
jgi:hypothetical protein